MARRRKKREDERPGPAGFLVVDKQMGETSHDAVEVVRRCLGTRRVGHLGTLDPQATGVLPVAVREATKLVRFVTEGRKSYVGTVRLGTWTDTLDGEGRILGVHDGALPTEADVRDALAGFRGDIEQIPPMFSAVKHGGVPLHRLARQGEVVQRSPKKVRIYHLELRSFESPDAEIVVECSPGTYVRTLAADLGELLGCGAYLMSLRRLMSGPFREDQALRRDELESRAAAGTLDSCIIPCAEALGLPVLSLAEEPLRHVRHGGDISPGTRFRGAPGARVLAVDEAGLAVAVLELRGDRRLWPLRVLSTDGS